MKPLKVMSPKEITRLVSSSMAPVHADTPKLVSSEPAVSAVICCWPRTKSVSPLMFTLRRLIEPPLSVTPRAVEPKPLDV